LTVDLRNVKVFISWPLWHAVGAQDFTPKRGFVVPDVSEEAPILKLRPNTTHFDCIVAIHAFMINI